MRLKKFAKSYPPASRLAACSSCACRRMSPTAPRVTDCVPEPRAGVAEGEASGLSVGSPSGEAAGVCAGELSGEASGVALGGAEGLFSWRSSPLFFSQLGTARTSKVTLVARSTTHSAVNRMFRQFGLLLCGLFRV